MSDQPTLKALQDLASELEIDGRSSMDRDELERAIAHAQADAGSAPPAPPVPPPPGPSEQDGRPPLAEVARERYTRAASKAVNLDREDS